jgi:class 3 adenylate cyclase
MPRRSITGSELLLVILRLLDQRPMPVRELLARLDDTLPTSRVRSGRVVTALSSLEAEGLVEVMDRDRAEVYRVTSAGSDAIARRTDVVVAAVGARPRRGLSKRSPEPEIHDVAVLFTDLVGSTEMLDSLGDETAHEIRRRHFELLRHTLAEHGGQEVKSLGDGLMAVFETAPAAASCGVAMQRAVTACDDGLLLRVGIASGETVGEEGDYFGRPVIVAKRLCDAAGAGDVLMSGSAPGPALDGERLAPISLKGLSEPVTPTRLRAQPVGAG